MLKTERDICCGCMACVSVCPKGIIEVCEDELGFKYPIIKNKEKCVGCNKCNLVCNMNRKSDLNAHCDEVYAVKAKCERELSQSGGLFATIAKTIIEEGGIVFGVIFDEKTGCAYYKGVSKASEIKKMLGSKYVQADDRYIFQEVIEKLREGKKVLFYGSPCFVDNLRKLAESCHLDKNLMLIDFVCHGASSPRIFSDYYKYINNKFGNINGFIFRDKNVTGWHGHRESFFSLGKKYTSSNYANIYYSHLAFRQRCYSCPYTNQDRVGDITAGDFWGIERSNPEFDDNLGCSIFVVNTEKGKELWEKNKEKFEWISEKIDNGLQPTLIHPIPIPREREEFLSKYESEGFKKTVKKYCKWNDKDFISKSRYKFNYFLIKIFNKMMIIIGSDKRI